MNSLSGHSKTFSHDSEIPEFLGLNLEALRGLANFADLSEGFTIAFAEVGFAADTEILIAALKQRPECQTIQFEVLDFSERQIDSLLTELTQSLSTIEIEPNKKLVLVIRGLEKSIGAVIEYPIFLQDLNFVRDALARRFAHPMIFVLPKYAMKRLARKATDFWAWATTVFEFRSTRQSVETVQSETMNTSRSFSSDLKPVKQSRIEQLHRLSEEYAPTDQDEDGANADLRLDIWLELGDAYGSLGDIGKAELCFQRALELAQISRYKRRKADALLGLGKTLRITQTSAQSIEVFEQALTIYREVGDRLGEANTLRAQGDVLQFLKQSREALANYEQALTIYREVGARLGEANTLRAQGEVLQFLDQRSEALANYEQALTIYREVGDRLGEANTLRAQGEVLQFLKQSREALANYEQALTIYREVGARLGEANTLRAQGEVLQFLDQRSEALANYEQALTIYREVGDRLGEANTLRAQGDVLQFLKQSREALANYEQALTIYREVGDRLGEANTLQAQGEVLQFLKQSREALANYEQALTIYREVGARLGEANTLLALGVLKEDSAERLEAFLAAQTIYEAIGDQYSQGRNLAMFIGPTYRALDQSDLAKAAFETVAHIGKAIGFEPFVQYAQEQIEKIMNES